MQQALGIEQHQLVELPPLRFSHLASLQSLKVQPDGRDRRLQFMGDRVDEAVVLLVAANFPDQKNRIEDQPHNDDEKKYGAEKKLQTFAPVQDDPTDVQYDRRCNQANAQRAEKINRLLPADDAHRKIVAGRVSGVR